ncbi:MAG: alpha/beta fold hydrolase [Deltaproteobacteria bacterium]
MLSTDFRPSPELYPFESRWFEGPRGRMHYLDQGQGQPILLVHGNPTWSFLYRKMIPWLTKSGFRCVVPDLLGYGLSEHPVGFGFTAREQVEALLALVQALELEELVVLGQDWGGPIALGVAVQTPESIRGIVLGSTFAWRASGITRCIGHVLRLGMVQRWMVNGAHFIEWVMGLARTSLTRQELDHYQLVASVPDLRRAKAILPLELIDADEWLDELERAVVERLGEARTLLVHGKKDAFSGSAVRRLARMLPDHVVLTLPHAGHFFQEDAHREVSDAIRERFCLGAST